MASTMNSPRVFGQALALIFVLLLVPGRSTGQEKSTEGAGKHLGTWRLVSTKYGEATEFTKYREGSKRLKLINATHFTWVEVNADTKEVISLAGGSYKLAGNTYTETIEWAGEGMQDYLGKPQKFQIQVEGDKLFQSGELSNGLKIEENWERVK